jgi:hypothetical protein
MSCSEELEESVVQLPAAMVPNPTDAELLIKAMVSGLPLLCSHGAQLPL